MTTDTTEATEKSFKRGQIFDEELGDMEKFGEKNAQEGKEEVQEGILSSDEEEQANSQAAIQADLKKRIIKDTKEQHEEITSFVSEDKK